MSGRLLLPEHSVTSLDVVHHADALAFLRGARWLVRDGSMPRYHAVFADPPYFLGSIVKRYGKPDAAPAKDRDGLYQRQARGFMGQTWDGFESPWHYQAWVAEWAALLLDVVYPGALLMMFGGTRTYHRLACGLEDAGWEIVDSLMWVYGSGFPKSHDISKALDREAGAEREAIRLHHNPASSLGNGRTMDGGAAQSGVHITAPATPAAERWQGYGTALKPAYEPIVLARAPRGARTYAALAREFGTGALNVDGGRIAGETLTFQHTDKTSRSAGIKGNPSAARAGEVWVNATGRWPANVILDEHAAAALDAQSGEKARARYDDDDVSGASRFFYTAKASVWEREAGLNEQPQATVTDGRKTPIDNPYQRGETKRRNVHPTVKPIQLTEYLARLLLPPELDEPRRLLVPFAGVGSEIIGARLAGWDVVTGIEQGAEYVALARPRIAWWAQFSSYEQARAAYQADRDDEARVEAARAAGVEQLSLLDTEVA